MTHYIRDYTGLRRDKADVQALQDMRSYLGPKAWAYMEQEFLSLGEGTMTFSVAKKWLQAINFACMLTGVQGYPVRAFKRRFFQKLRGL